MKISTAQEAINGNSNDTVITPLRLKQVLNSKNIGGGGSGEITKETDPVFKSSPAGSITTSDVAKWNAKQEALVSGENIKTINGIPILGEGDINITTPEEKSEVIISPTTPTTGEEIWVQKSFNLFVPKIKDEGYSMKDDGSFEYKANDYYFINDYLEIEPNTTYTFGNRAYSSGRNAWYDSNKQLISTFAQPNNYSVTVKSPANAKYVRISLYKGTGHGNDLNTFQFVKGTTLPPYSKAIEGSKIYVTDFAGGYDKIYDTTETPTFEDLENAIPDIPEVEPYILPPATQTTLGGIKVGDNLTIDADGTLHAQPGGGGGTGYIEIERLI
jgi:hypothetical protein